MVEVGKKYSYWTVLERVSNKDHYNNNPRYLVRCDCGKECVRYGRPLETGNSISCGCIGRTKLRVGLENDMLTITKRLPNDNGKAMWRCACKCGGHIDMDSARWTRGKKKNCGCLDRKTSDSPVYGIWSGMRQRCSNPNSNGYKHYGGRGISVCQEWDNDFWTFHDWAMSSGYKKELSLDRINNDGNYEPSNCKWSNQKTQNRNTRSNNNFTYRGSTMCLSAWEEVTGISRHTLRRRINSGWPKDDVINQPPGVTKLSSRKNNHLK